MIKVHKPKRPTKKSGFELKQGAKTTVRGVTIINQNSFSVYVDKFTPRVRKPAKKFRGGSKKRA